uniref:Uncharacterized protein n=1 Tax=Onchocerca volvulus TaxID=6282 RepID=A0A8R1Y204_ONCVO
MLCIRIYNYLMLQLLLEAKFKLLSIWQYIDFYFMHQNLQHLMLQLLSEVNPQLTMHLYLLCASESVAFGAAIVVRSEPQLTVNLYLLCASESGTSDAAIVVRS